MHSKKYIFINSRFGKYKVEFISDLRKVILACSRFQRLHLLIDKNIFELHSEIFNNLSFISIKKINALEKNKTLEEILEYITYLLRNDIKKNNTIMVVGGGLVQDIGSFTAHILLRGIDWIFVPTTLLSMADSCIGSKSGINVGTFKNQVGSFHPPKNIYIDISFLQTLSRTGIFDGNGEIIKHAIIKGGKVFDRLTKNISEIKKNRNATTEIIYDSLLVKKEIIEEDEFDKSVRRLLNYGHTFGHALEGYTKNKIPHGIGVSIGMDIANFISVKRHMLGRKDFYNISALLHQSIPYEKLPTIRLAKYLNFLAHDKKVIDNTVSAILCRGIGQVEITKIKIDKQLQQEIQDYFVEYANLHTKGRMV